MPQVGQAIIAALYWVSGAIGGGAAVVTGSTAVGGAVATAVFYGLYYGAQVGLSMALTAATIPRPEVGHTNFKQSTPPRRFAYGRCRLAGYYAFWEARGNWAASVVMLHDGAIDHFGQVWLNDDRVTLRETDSPSNWAKGDVITLPDGRYPAGFVNISLRRGLFTETVHANIRPNFPEWTSNHRLDGISSLSMLCGHGKTEEFQNRYPNGEPQPSVETWAQQVFDPRDPAQDIAVPSTWQWTDNAPLCHLHWEFFRQRRAYDDVTVAGRLTQVFNAGRWARLFAPQIDMWVEAANVADEAVALKAGGTTKRYTLGGFAEEGTAPDAIRKQFLATYDGWMSQDGNGAITIYAGKYYEPTVVLGDDDIDDYSFQRFTEDEQSINELAIRFTDPTTDYTTAEPTPWRDFADVAARNGKVRADLLDLPWVQSTSQARRLAKRQMVRLQAFARGTIKTKMTDAALSALGKRFVRIQISETATLATLPVEITRAEIDLMNMSIIFDWVAANPAMDDWNAAAEEGDPPSTAARPAGVGVPVPSGVDAEAVFESAGAGGQGVRLVVSFDDPNRPDISYIVRWKAAGDVAYSYQQFSSADDLGSTLSVKTGFVPADDVIDVSVAFIGGAGGQGGFATDVVVDTTTAGLSSGPVTAVLAANGAGQSVVTWVNPASILFASARVYRANAGQVFADAVAVSGDIVGAPSAAGTFTNTGVAAGSYLYWVVAKSTAGVLSSPAGPDAATIT